ncbi:hypothetical protein TNIN_244701 [Trichonephila inaurata madagascariensis]|uniref:Uncharacterized protein n=1 Tax=Trichonephila inaurata madagascariensis TaxID=2747483 RepID=A0A8X7CGB2_9ARAC|nr:hypothetical protein TNIN_244701 [Trichonephila inaurata madagascariensis]
MKRKKKSKLAHPRERGVGREENRAQEKLGEREQNNRKCSTASCILVIRSPRPEDIYILVDDAPGPRDQRRTNGNEPRAPLTRAACAPARWKQEISALA